MNDRYVSLHLHAYSMKKYKASVCYFSRQNSPCLQASFAKDQYRFIFLEGVFSNSLSRTLRL